MVFSAISGCVWAAIAWLLLDQRTNVVIAAGMLASPLIGVVAGMFSKGFRERSALARAAIALTTLYFAAALFGGVAGTADFLWSERMAPRVGAIIETVWLVVWGLTSGYVLILWPLSYLNHWVIAQAWQIPIGTGSESVR